jgi:transposase-like protein
MPGDDTDHPPPDTEATPADAFALVGNEIRAEIIWVLGDPAKDEMELSFGELRSRLATEVEPSQLHYHLQQLLGHFVTKTDAGYRLSGAGIRLCLILRAGTFDRRQEHLAVDTDVDCHYCQAPVEAIFDQIGIVNIVCSDCDHSYGGEFLHIPLAAFEDGAAAFSFSHFRKYMALKTLFMARGVCPSCAYPLSPEFYSREGQPIPRKVLIEQSCDLCGILWYLSVGRALLADPGLRSFCSDHGVDIVSTPYWELEFAATDNYITVRSTDPWEVALDIMFDGDTLELVVDGDLNVIERNRLGVGDEGSTSLLRGVQRSVRALISSENVDGATLPDDEACMQTLRRLRWRDGVMCPHCDGADLTEIGMTSKDAQRHRCNDCESTFNDLTGTVFAKHRLSLPEMFYIIRARDETSTSKIAQQLDRSYKPVLKFVHKIQNALEEDS